MTYSLDSHGFQTRPFASGLDFLEELSNLKPGFVILDLRMPDLDGMDVLRAMAPSDIERFSIIMMTGHGDVASAVEALKIGAIDFLEKPCQEEKLLVAIDRGLARLDSALDTVDERARALAAVGRMSGRERDVFDGLVDGKANKAIAYDLGLSVRTVEMHRARLMDRLQVRSLSEIFRIAGLAGIVPADAKKA